MSRSKKIYLAFFALWLFALAACDHPTATVTTQRPRIAVVAKSTSSSFWRSVRAGASAAANEYNLEFTFDGPASEEDVAGQNALIDKAVADGASAIVFSAVDYSASSETVARAADAGVYIIIIDSDIDSDRVSVRIGTDNYEAGASAARVLVAGEEKQLYVGVVGFDVHTQNGQARENGFSETLASTSNAKIVETINVPSVSEDAQAAARDMLRRHPEINAVVTFNELTTLGVGHAIAELGLQDAVRTVGFDNNVISVGMLETGELDVLIVQNPYAMGYLGVENASLLISGKTPESTVIYTEARAIDRTVMYTEQNQKFLFSFTENQ